MQSLLRLYARLRALPLTVKGLAAVLDVMVTCLIMSGVQRLFPATPLGTTTWGLLTWVLVALTGALWFALIFDLRQPEGMP